MATVLVNAVDRSTDYSPTEFEAISIRLTARDGEVGQGTAPIPDPAGTATPYAGQSFQFKVGSTFIIDGFVGPLMRDRGEGAVGPRVVDTYAVGDENAVLQGFRAFQWERPAETTKARFLAFLAAFVPWVTDTTWVTDDVVADLAKKTYTTTTLFNELFAEIKDLTGNTAFIENHRAHLHPPTVGIAGGLSFSDAAYDFSTSFPIYNPKRSKDPIDLRDDVMVTTPTASATATDATAIARYDAGGLKHQELVQLDAGDATLAAAKAAGILADAKAERIMYEFDTGPLTAAQVASIPVGSLVSITSSVMGLSASTQRIAAITLTYIHPNLFKAHIEMGYPVRIRVGVRSGPTVPYGVATPVASLVQLMRENDHYPVAGGFMLGWDHDGDNPQAGDGYTPKTGYLDYNPQPKPANGWESIAVLGNGTVDIHFKADMDGVASGDLQIEWTIRRGTDIVATSTDASSGGLRFVSSGCDFTATDIAVLAGEVISGWCVAIVGGVSFFTIPSGTGNGSHELRATGNLSLALPFPVTGTVIGPEIAGGTIDGINQDFTTAGPWLAGTLRVEHDGTDQTAHIASSDNAAGTFHLDYAPSVGSIIKLFYTAA